MHRHLFRYMKVDKRENVPDDFYDDLEAGCYELRKRLFCALNSKDSHQMDSRR